MTNKQKKGQHQEPSDISRSLKVGIRQDDLFITIGKMLANIESLQGELRFLKKVLCFAGSLVGALIGAIIVYFWTHPHKWLQLVEFLK